MGTPCRTLASYVVFQNHLPMAADYPSAYRAHPALPILAAIPATWDDTKFLAGAVGEYVVIARRRGDVWWVGAMGDQAPRAFDLPLDFLGKGRFRAEHYSDDRTAAPGFSLRAAEVTAARTIQCRLAPAGGALVRLTPLAGSP